MPILSKGSTKILFIHIPKTGGSSVQTLFKQSGYELSMFSITDFSEGCSPQHFHRDILLQKVDFSCLDVVFTIVRDPVIRLISEYNFRMDSRIKRGQPLIRISEWMKKTFTAYNTKPFIHDNHIRPQHEFIVPGCRVYRYEQGLENIIAGLLIDNEIEVSDWPSGKLEQAQLAGKYIDKSNTLTMSDMITIRHFYRNDYQLLGYPINSEVIVNL
ncbi:MAG: sulfotransferase family protein [Methylovulum sp.]|nr:sulfotransferase family protein [Methylovulum sp.]